MVAANVLVAPVLVLAVEQQEGEQGVGRDRCQLGRRDPGKAAEEKEQEEQEALAPGVLVRVRQGNESRSS